MWYWLWWLASAWVAGNSNVGTQTCTYSIQAVTCVQLAKLLIEGFFSSYHHTSSTHRMICVFICLRTFGLCQFDLIRLLQFEHSDSNPGPGPWVPEPIAPCYRLYAVSARLCADIWISCNSCTWQSSQQKAFNGSQNLLHSMHEHLMPSIGNSFGTEERGHRYIVMRKSSTRPQMNSADGCIDAWHTQKPPNPRLLWPASHCFTRSSRNQSSKYIGVYNLSARENSVVTIMPAECRQNTIETWITLKAASRVKKNQTKGGAHLRRVQILSAASQAFQRWNIASANTWWRKRWKSNLKNYQALKRYTNLTSVWHSFYITMAVPHSYSKPERAHEKESCGNKGPNPIHTSCIVCTNVGA